MSEKEAGPGARRRRGRLRLRELGLALMLLASPCAAFAGTPPAAVKIPLPKGWREVEPLGHTRNFQLDGTTRLLSITVHMQIPDGFPDEVMLTGYLSDIVSATRSEGDEAVFTSGTCAFGRFAKAIISMPRHKGRVLWIARDGTHAMLAGFEFDETPKPQELATADSIVKGVSLTK